MLAAPVLGVLAAEPERAASPMSTVLAVSRVAVGVYRGVELWDTEDLCGKSRANSKRGIPIISLH